MRFAKSKQTFNFVWVAKGYYRWHGNGKWGVWLVVVDKGKGRTTGRLAMGRDADALADTIPRFTLPDVKMNLIKAGGSGSDNLSDPICC